MKSAYAPTIATTIIASKSQGPREYMEDRHCAVGGKSDGDDRPLVVGVFDGHGGDGVAAFAAKVLPQIVLKQWGQSQDKVALFARAFVQADTLAAKSLRTNTVGSTACVAVIDPLTRTLWVANTGDSRCVMRTPTEVVQMSTDHKPETPQEHLRIRNSGGYVQNVHGIHRVMGNLSVSRSLGDWYMRPFVIPHPGVSQRKLGEGTVDAAGGAYLLLATDGLWDVFESKGACDFLDNELRGSKARRAPALKRLVAEARRRGSQDNITVLAVFFEK